MGDLFKGANTGDSEAVEVIIQPAHGILKSNMKVIECVTLGDLDSSPDRWFGIQQSALELINVCERPFSGNCQFLNNSVFA